MTDKWTPLPISGKLYENLDETQLRQGFSALENCFVNENGGHSRFWGLQEFTTLPDDGRVYLHDWRGDLIAVTSRGRVYRVNRAGQVEDMTGVPVSGGRRVIFAKTEDELVMAAGRQMVRFAGRPTEILSEDAPEATHVAYIDGFLLAVERDSGRFYNAEAGATRSWSPLDVFSADGKPDNIDAMIVTPFRELILGGIDSFEQFERLATGDAPFFRRWAIGEGISAAYTMIFADNAVFCVNRSREWIRFSGQVTQPISNDIGLMLESIDDWTDTWTGGYPDRPLDIFGQRFVLLQMPNARNAYGTKGVTLIFDYRNKKFSHLYGWDYGMARPVRWPGWSHWAFDDQMYVGGEGKIYRFVKNDYWLAGAPTRMLGRTSHVGEGGPVEIQNLRMQVKRGVGGNATQPLIKVRCKRDNKTWTNWKEKGLGKAGDGFMFLEFGGYGIGHSFQFEWSITDNCPVEIRKVEAIIAPAS